MGKESITYFSLTGTPRGAYSLYFKVCTKIGGDGVCDGAELDRHRSMCKMEAWHVEREACTG